MLLFWTALTACAPLADEPADNLEIEAASGPQGWALIEDACAPDDGMAYDLLIGVGQPECGAVQAPQEWLRIAIWEGELPVDGTWSFEDDGEEGAGWYQPAAADEDWMMLEDGALEMSDWSGEDTLEGSYEVHTEDGALLIGDFTAVRCEAPVTCN